jgi:hypothetical protein
MEHALAELEALVRNRIRRVCADGTVDGQGALAAGMRRIPLLGGTAGMRPQSPFRNNRVDRSPGSRGEIGRTAGLTDESVCPRLLSGSLWLW